MNRIEYPQFFNRPPMILGFSYYDLFIIAGLLFVGTLFSVPEHWMLLGSFMLLVVKNIFFQHQSLAGLYFLFSKGDFSWTEDIKRLQGRL